MLPSVVLINGSFGVGKTSVARALRRRVAGSVIYERVGERVDTEGRSIVEVAEGILAAL